MLPFPINSVIEDSVSRLRVSWKGSTSFERDSGTTFAHMVMRDRFDALLLDHARRAGADFRPGTTVRAAKANGLVEVRGEDGFGATASYIVAADGAHSPTGKMLGLGADIAECPAWEVEVRGSALQRMGHEGRALIELGYRPWGYAWLFPKAEVLSIGIVVPPEQARTMKARVTRYIDSLGLRNADIAIARGHKIRMRRGGERIANERVVLAGDAAGMADEFTEEGISYAIHSGRLAARNVLRALGGGDLRDYERDVDREIQPELRAARQVAYMFYGMLGRFPRPWMFASGRVGYLWDAFFAVQKGESTYAREAARIPLLPRIASHLMERK